MQGNERLQAARVEAQASRDILKGGEALVNIWREVCKPRKAGAVKLQPPGSKADTEVLFQRWLEDRGLGDALELSGQVRGWHIYRYARQPVIESRPDWETAFHGTWWYALWMVLHTGILLESSDRSLGHDFWEPGVYCSPNLDTGIWYARPHILFGDGVYHRVIFELRVDPKRRKRNRKAGGVQWVFPCDAIQLYGVWLRSNVPPSNGEERINNWDPELEAIPLGRSRPPAIVNPRKEPWPYMQDPWPWDHEGESDVPPWMRSTVGKPKSAKEAASAGPQSFGKHHLGGLYGHWLNEVSSGAPPRQEQLKLCAVAQNDVGGPTTSSNHFTNGDSSLARLPASDGNRSQPSSGSIFAMLLRSVSDDCSAADAVEPPARKTLVGDLLAVGDNASSTTPGEHFSNTTALRVVKPPPKPRAAGCSLPEPQWIPKPAWKRGASMDDNLAAMASQFGFPGGWAQPPPKRQC